MSAYSFPERTAAPRDDRTGWERSDEDDECDHDFSDGDVCGKCDALRGGT